jgi:hypothetical protein
MTFQLTYDDIDSMIDALTQYIDNSETDDDDEPIIPPHVQPLLRRLEEARLGLLGMD